MTGKITTGGTLTIGDTELHVEDVEFVGPKWQWFDVQEPDPAWRHTDSEGHEHRWMAPLGDSKSDGELPTAVRSVRRIECDGSCGNWDCDGYDEPVWHCRVCGDEIAPGRRPSQRSSVVEAGYLLVQTMSPARRAIPSVSNVRGTPASIVWPSGPGQMTNYTGRAWEQLDGEVTIDSRGATERRSFRLSLEIPA